MLSSPCQFGISPHFLSPGKPYGRRDLVRLRCISLPITASKEAVFLRNQMRCAISISRARNRSTSSRQEFYVMKRILTLVLLCSFAVALAQTAGAQSRPRRVGASPPPQQQDQQTQPQQPSTQSQTQANDGSQPTQPSRPPVLGGANRDPNEQKPESTKSKDAALRRLVQAISCALTRPWSVFRSA